MAWAIFECSWRAGPREKKDEISGNRLPRARRPNPVKRMLVLTLGLALLTGAFVGTASAQHLSGDRVVDSERAWPTHCKKKPLPDEASEVARTRLAHRLCKPIAPPDPCWRVPCDPAPDPCRVIDDPASLDIRLPCPPPPCLDRPDSAAPSDNIAGLTWWPCPPPPCPLPQDGDAGVIDGFHLTWWRCPPPCPVPLDGEAGLVWWPCPIPPEPPCPLPADALTWAPCPIPPPLSCEAPINGKLSEKDQWRCPDVKPRPDPGTIDPQPVPVPLPLPLPVVPDFEPRL